MGPRVGQEPTCSSTQAASELGLSRQRIDQLFRKGRLKGPSRLPRAPIRLFQWSIEEEKVRRRGGTSSMTQPDARGVPQEKNRTVAELRGRVEAIEHRLSEADASIATLRSANLALNAAFDDLREALTEDDEAIELLAEALRRSRRATRAVRRAEERRANILDQFQLPDFAPDA